MNGYRIQTDLACESEITHDCEKGGTHYEERTENGFKIAKLNVLNENGEAQTRKKIGSYVTIFTKTICNIEEKDSLALADIIAKETETLLYNALGKSPKCVLIAGLGNREITADNIGPKVVDRITATRHLEAHNKRLFDAFCKVAICAVAPGVLGQTGIETAEMIGGICDRSSPDAIIAIDALAARSTERLGSTIQITDSGIFPGSGIGNRRSEISKSTLGIPVIAIGIPTVVNSSTLVYDALMRAGHSEIDEELQKVLHEGESFFVSPRQSDQISEQTADLLASAVNKMFLY